MMGHHQTVPNLKFNERQKRDRRTILFYLAWRLDAINANQLTTIGKKFEKNFEYRWMYFQRNDLISMLLGVHQRDEEIFSHELYENTPKCARMKLFIRFNTISSSFYARNSSVVQSRKVLKWRYISNFFCQ